MRQALLKPSARRRVVSLETRENTRAEEQIQSCLAVLSLATQAPLQWDKPLLGKERLPLDSDGARLHAADADEFLVLVLHHLTPA